MVRRKALLEMNKKNEKKLAAEIYDIVNWS